MNKILTIAAVMIIFVSTSSVAQQSLTPSAAVNIALSDNPELAAARIRIEEANARLLQAGLLPNPELELEGKFDFEFNTESKNTFSIGIVQPFSISGRIAAQKDVARVEIDRAIAEAVDLERRITGDVRRFFIELFAINEQIKLQGVLISLNEELLRATRAALSRGIVSEKDVNATLIAQQQTLNKKKILESHLRSKVMELNRLMGRPAGSDFVAEGSLEMPALPELSSLVLEKVLESRPDYISVRLEADLVFNEQRLIKAEQFDTWRIGVNYERERGSQENGTDQFIGLKLSIPLPFFDKKQGRILETSAKKEHARKRADALKFQISHELGDAFNRAKTLTTLLESYSPDILKRAEDNLKLVESGYRRGLTGITEVVQSRRQFAELKSSYIEMLAEYQRAIIDIEIAAGIFPGITKLRLANEVNYNEKINK